MSWAYISAEFDDRLRTGSAVRTKADVSIKHRHQTPNSRESNTEKGSGLSGPNSQPMKATLRGLLHQRGTTRMATNMQSNSTASSSPLLNSCLTTSYARRCSSTHFLLWTDAGSFFGDGAGQEAARCWRAKTDNRVDVRVATRSPWRGARDSSRLPHGSVFCSRAMHGAQEEEQGPIDLDALEGLAGLLEFVFCL